MTFRDILRAWYGIPATGNLHNALAPLVTIADKFDANQLGGIAQKVGCCGLNTARPEEMVLCWDRWGHILLTVADCLKARDALRGHGEFSSDLVVPSQTEKGPKE